LIKIAKLEIVDSQATYTDEAKDFHYNLFISRLRFELTNLSKHFSENTAHLDLRGLFTGGGPTTIRGFSPSEVTARFDLELAIHEASLPSLNDLLCAYGKSDVQAGKLSVYSQASARRGEMTDYVKPLFSNVKGL